MEDDGTHSLLQINQNLIIGLAIAASILAIVLYYENRQMQNQLAALASVKRPCNCPEHFVTEEVQHSPNPSTMPLNQKPPEVVID